MKQSSVFKDRLEGMLQATSSREVCVCVCVGGLKDNRQSSTSVEGTSKRANQLNLFFKMFDHPTLMKPARAQERTPHPAVTMTTASCSDHRGHDCF